MKIKIIGNKNISENFSPNFPRLVPDSPKVLLKRKVRLGDIVMALPVAKKLTKDGYRVFFCTKPEYKTILDLSVPKFAFVDFAKYNPSDYSKVLNIDRISANGKKQCTSKIDLFFATAGFEPSEISDEDKKPQIQCTEEMRNWANKFFESHGISDIINVIVSIESYNPRSPRSVPVGVMSKLFEEHLDVNFILVGTNPIDIPKWSNVMNWTGNTPSLQELISIIDRSDYIVSIDTGVVHVSGALNKPMIVIFGPTRPDFLVKYYDDVIVLDANRECSPCWEKGCGNICTPHVPPQLISRFFDELIDGFRGRKTINFNGNII